MATTRVEWLVLGEPGSVDGTIENRFPSYSHVWRLGQRIPNSRNDERFTDPEDLERHALEFVARCLGSWESGPFLHRREVTETDWVPIEEVREVVEITHE